MTAVPVEHANEARLALREIVAEHGPAALSEPTLFSRLLSDLLPEAPGIARLLTSAAQDRVADTLRQHVAQGMDIGIAVSLTAHSLATTTLATPQVCTWVVSEFAIALGLLANADGPAATETDQADPTARADLTGQTTSAGSGAVTQHAGPAATAVASQAGPAATAVASQAGPAATAVASADLGTPTLTVAAGNSASLASGPVTATGPADLRTKPVLAAAGVVLLALIVGLLVWAPWSGGSRSGGAPQPLSAAVLTGSFTAHELIITSNHEEPKVFTLGTTFSDSWEFTPTCGSGPCAVTLSGAIRGVSITATLNRSGASYAGYARTTKLEQCGSAGDHSVLSVIHVRITIDAATRGQQRQATAWSGSMVVHNSLARDGSLRCPADSWSSSLRS